jgi:hypothetical protein
MIANLSGTPKRLSQMAIGSTSTTLYTSQPDGKTAILDIMVVNTTSASINLTMYIGSVASGNEFGWYQTPIPAKTSVQYSGYQILNQNESLLALGSAVGLTASISGVERV